MANTKCLILTFLMVGALVLNEQIVSADECDSQITSLDFYCRKFIGKEGIKLIPTKECCEQLRKADVPCVCKRVTPAVEAMISMEKVVFIARICLVTVKPGTKCGSYIVKDYTE
ncbi:hypothetical protein M5689_018016 [Euphorbia peplus]|nr:hypothetical protein M5689_018016 [Euphorbia peplus]